MNEEVKIKVPPDILANWQGISDLLAEMFGIPVALIMQYLNPHIEVLVASHSTGNPYHPGDKEVLLGSGLYCETVLRTQEKLLVPDALADEKWKNNPDVKLKMISYLGFPIRLPDKTPFGTICVLDNKANRYSETTEKLMLKFRDLLESHLEVIYVNQCLGEKNKKLTDYLLELQALRGLVAICSNCKSIRDDQDHWHPIEHYLVRHPLANFSHGICPKCENELYPEPDKKA